MCGGARHSTVPEALKVEWFQENGANPPRGGPDNVQNRTELLHIPRRVNHDKVLGHPGPSTSERMSFAPTLPDDSGSVQGMQSHMARSPVGRMNVSNFLAWGAGFRIGRRAGGIRRLSVAGSIDWPIAKKRIERTDMALVIERLRVGMRAIRGRLHRRAGELAECWLEEKGEITPLEAGDACYQGVRVRGHEPM
jgi:hypothetical protein